MDVQELIEALDQRILDAIAAKATGETIVRLCEATGMAHEPGPSTSDRSTVVLLTSRRSSASPSRGVTVLPVSRAATLLK